MNGSDSGSKRLHEQDAAGSSADPSTKRLRLDEDAGNASGELSSEELAKQKRREKLEAWRREKEAAAAAAAAAAPVTATTAAAPAVAASIGPAVSLGKVQPAPAAPAMTISIGGLARPGAQAPSVFGLSGAKPATIRASVFGNDNDDDDDDDGSGSAALSTLTLGAAHRARKSKLAKLDLNADDDESNSLPAATTNAQKQGNSLAEQSNANPTGSGAVAQPMDVAKAFSNGAVNKQQGDDDLDAYMMNVQATVRELNIRKESGQPATAAATAMTLDSELQSADQLEADDAALIFGHGDNEDLQEKARNVTAKKKELGAVDHSKIVYPEFSKNFYKEVPELARMTELEVKQYRRELENIKVKGDQPPRPIKNWSQCGVNALTLKILTDKCKFEKPTPIQAQAVPAVMSGRDLIAIAKTGSGKTLAFVLPMIRHILAQPPLSADDGPIGLILTPTRELAVQTYTECKRFAAPNQLRTVCLYGGSAITEQIADLKRGAEIIVCTPGRMIDMLTANSGRVTNLRRVTYLVLDEADRMFDMGFEPQVMRIVNNIRPARQTVLFSATFPRSMETLAYKILHHSPLQIIVGGRSIVSKEIDQHVLVIPEAEKYLRLLELLGVWQEEGSVIVFVERQEAADMLLKSLYASGYPCLSLHAGLDQGDREETLIAFKAGDVRLLIATSVAARGLDVKELKLVVNYDAPNHYEDYVHRVGRTGRAGRKGTSYTFLTPEQGRFAGDILNALQLSGANVPEELKQLKEQYEADVKSGKAKGGKFSVRKGKGFGFTDEENNKANALKNMQKAAMGLGESDDEDSGPSASTPSTNSALAASASAGGDDDDGPDALDEEIERKLNASRISSGAPAPSAAPATATSAPAATGQVNKEALAAIVSSVSNRIAAASGGGESAAVPVSVSAAAERARQIAASIGRRLPTAAGSATGDAANPAAAMAAAAASAAPPPPALMAVAPVLQFIEHLEINDFPQRARWRVTQKEAVSAISELSGAALTPRGVFIGPGKVPGPNEKKLYIVIEADNDFAVQKAKTEIKRIIREELAREADNALQNRNLGGSTNAPGRYSVL
ncbi:DEAD box ATP-dependent RNA helicase [Capsaspora owczarzaki ATCC 30864]|uniref:RNA helicase n=1 Tax=Capsaspora owczarzaki (strain ATCC 30864) TaxID=595528 RepID=A0A0D2U214_CAPO3|nr:DEAD box ATP-dependent RNA helicase [Capsaspora owczarzaki ATCC 30864]KJE89266.1 DEAD box ATP-dependent RNA helicase [Capsaspora owczarzaki ATCC 30864]|eukprot:XP_004365647.1 DEAD box ATP-dependent RNA helicase [Capsaspora owczarzaki ATCC 30864]